MFDPGFPPRSLKRALQVFQWFLLAWMAWVPLRGGVLPKFWEFETSDQPKETIRDMGVFNQDFTKALPTTGKIEGFQASTFFVAKNFWGEMSRAVKIDPRGEKLPHRGAWNQRRFHELKWVKVSQD